jgi:hypothetical protein
MKKNIILILFVICNLLFVIWFPLSSAYASYVLPYPSYMPGNKLYTLSRVIDRMSAWWYFGSIAQVKYHLKLSDKYLVESKTLFEYQQYLLAVDALHRSDQEFLKIPEHISKAFREGKDVTNLSEMIQTASEKHREVLSEIASNVPASFQWTPEKSPSTGLDLGSLLREAASERIQVYDQLSKQ